MVDKLTSVYGKQTALSRHVDISRKGRAYSRFEIGYASLLLLVFSLSYLTGEQGLFPWMVLGIDFFCILMRKPSLLIPYSAFLVGNEAASVLILVVWMIGSSDVKLARIMDIKLDQELLFLGIVILALSFCQAWRAGTIANTIISALYICFLGILAFACSQSVIYEDLIRCTRLIVVLEFLTSLIICAKTGFIPGDEHFGTLSNAHFFGIICLVAFLLIANELSRGQMSGSRALAYLAMLIFMMLLADAKSVLGSGLICLFFFVIFWSIKNSDRTIVAFLWATVFAFVVLSFYMAQPDARDLLTQNDFPLSSFFSKYVYDDGPQNKFDYFMGTTTQMLSDGHILYGYGLGTYGSRFANMLGYTYTYRDPSAFNELASIIFSSRMIPEYIPFASAYNERLVSIIQWLSAVLTYPFSSFVALVAETGLFGVLALGRALRKLKLGGASQALVAMFIGVCITDLYFDRIQVIGLVILAIAGLENLRNAKKRKQLDIGGNEE